MMTTNEAPRESIELRRLDRTEGLVKRPALGASAQLGEMYDVRTDQPAVSKLIKRTLPAEWVERQDISHCEARYTMGDELTEKARLLDLDLAATLNLIACPSVNAGSVKFLYDNKKSARTVTASLAYNIKTVSESVSASISEMLPHVDEEALTNEQCTHVIMRIDWGANCIVTLSSRVTESRTKGEMTATVSGQVAKLLDIAAEGKGEGSDKTETDNIDIAVHADAIPEDTLPTTLKDAMAFLPRVPHLVRQVNHGKGQPLIYTLLPLDTFHRLKNLEKSILRTICSIEDSFSMSVAMFHETVAEVKRALFDSQRDVEDHQRYFPEALLRKLKAEYRDLETRENDFRAELRAGLVRARSGQDTIETVIRTLERLKNKVAVCKVEDLLDSLGFVRKKVNFVKEVESWGALYLSRDDDVTLLLQDSRKESYVLQVSEASKAADPERHTSSLHAFRELSERHRGAALFFVVDLDLGTTVETNADSSVRILRYRNGSVVSRDVLEDLTTQASFNVARFEGHEHVAYGPKQRVALELPCPALCFGSASLAWHCAHCYQPLEYGFDGHLYCECGRGVANRFRFRCAMDTHTDFAPMPPSFEQELEKLRPVKEVNILLLGQSGVGKSTWINSLTNYLAYETLDEARTKGVLHVIPASFVVRDSQGAKHVVQVGEPDDCEALEEGRSATQVPKTYTFPLDHHTVRIIDTPGLGDTAGYLKDKENMKAILEHIGYLTELHAICILLKSNEQRINAIFNFVIKELLVNLHKNAANNIVFCFTNARGSHYRSGDSEVLVQRLLREHDLAKHIPLCTRTMFCFDNEAFRYLCAKQHADVTYTQQELDDYNKSWDKSVAETWRLVREVKSLKPHRVADTKSLCHARQRVQNLIKPIAEITRIMEENLSMIEKAKQDLASHPKIEELEKEYKRTFITLEPVQLDKPRTVCTNNKCVEFHKSKVSNATYIEYTTHCHEPCGIRNLTPEKLPNYALLRCRAMSRLTFQCKQCGCSWRDHMHITYEQRRIENEFILEDKVEEFNETKSATERIQARLAEFETFRQQLEGEKKIISCACLMFSLFLRDNALILYNDCFQSYMDYLIDQEDKISHETGSDAVLRGLQEVRANYLREVKLLGDKEAPGSKPLTPDEVLGWETTLYQLKNMGPMIMRNVQMSEASNGRAQQYLEQPLPVKKVKTFADNIIEIKVSKKTSPELFDKMSQILGRKKKK